ncbi:MAG: hypothetical protein AAF645_17670 [Myxococcota bacterium]
MVEPDEHVLYEGIFVEFAFPELGPAIGDLLAMTGELPGRAPCTGRADWGQLVGLDFQQADDYFAIPSDTGDWAIWLYPVVEGNVVHHQTGPFDALQLHYNILRNKVAVADMFRHCIAEFSEILGRSATYLGVPLGTVPDFSSLNSDIDGVIAYWRGEGIEPGSNAALSVDY